MRLLFADKIATSAVTTLEAAGHVVVMDPSLKDAALTAALAEQQPDALVVRSTKVTAEHLEASSALSLVVRAGAGVNTIDLIAAGKRGVFVSNCPGKNAVAVAELVFGLLLAIDRHIADNVIDARAGVWNKGKYASAQGLKGRCLGLLGMGTIGCEVARRARAFDMDVVAWSRSLTPEMAKSLGVTFARSPTEVARQVDILSAHTALTPDTTGLIGAELLAALPDGATVINTTRAGTVDEAALLDAIEQRGFSAGLDVLASEPAGKTGEIDHPLARHERVVLTHHIGASTTEAQEAVASEVARVLLSYDATGRAPNCVNLERETKASHLLAVRHHDRVGVLAGVLACLRTAGINVQEMENTIFAGGGAALARIQVHGDPTDVVATLAEQPHVLHVTAVPIGRRG